MFSRDNKLLFRLSPTWERIIAFCAGAAGALVFPPFIGAWQGYVGFILFLILFFKQKRLKKELFWLAYLFGFAFFAVGFGWINNAFLIDDNQFAGYIPWVFMANGLFFGLFFGLPAVLSVWGKNIYAKGLIFCLAFVVFEWIRSFIFTGFPWNLLGTALSVSPLLIQGAAYIGTYGLSFLLLMFLCGLAFLSIGVFQRRFYKGALLFVIIPLGFVFFTGNLYYPVEEGTLKVRLVQPNIPQTFKWHPALAYKNFRQYIDLSRSNSLDGVDMVVWGETASPYFLDRDDEHRLEITQAVPDRGFLATGLLRAGIDNGETVIYNSLFVIDKAGDIKDYYDKVHLVPFGEYLPFREYLPDFMSPVAEVVGNLGRGEAFKNIEVKGLPLMGGAICYESIFPKEILNPEVKPEILLVLANDGWYGISAGPYQHLAAAQMRAVEEGITVVRSANTGISAVIYPNGDIVGKIALDTEGISDVILPKVLARETVYGQFGNTILLIILVFLLIFIYLINTSKSCKSTA